MPPKVTPIDALVGGILLNSIENETGIYSACANSNVKALLWGLEGYSSKIKLEKSEFETAAEFEARSQKLADILSQGRKMIVCQDLNDNEDAPFNYDAEKEEFAGNFSPSLRADLDFKSTGSYISKTRMGIRATVKRHFGVDYDVEMSAALLAAHSKCLDAGFTSVRFRVPIPRDKAPAVKRDAYLVIEGALRAPFISKSESPGSPTLDNPNDVYQVTLTATLAPSSVLVVMPNDEIVFRCDLASPK